MEDYEFIKVEDIAKLLRVSERTVYDWAHKGVIPGGKFGTSWRFKRSDVMKWIDTQLKSTKRSVSALPLPIARVLVPERIAFLDDRMKTDVLAQLVDVLATARQVHDRDELLSHVLRREELMSTGIGLGIAVPHVRLDSVDDIVMAVGICREAIDDYESLDGEPVRLLFMIAAHANQHTEHIKLLSAVAQCMKNESVRNALCMAETPQRAFDVLAGEE